MSVDLDKLSSLGECPPSRFMVIPQYLHMQPDYSVDDAGYLDLLMLR